MLTIEILDYSALNVGFCLDVTYSQCPPVHEIVKYNLNLYYDYLDVEQLRCSGYRLSSDNLILLNQCQDLASYIQNQYLTLGIDSDIKLTTYT